MTVPQPDALSIPRNNLGESVYRLLLGRILDRGLQPGEKLSGLRLSDELGVSRTPVREALQRLVSDGILRVEPNRGFFVESFSARDIGKIYDLRATLEAMALTEVAARFTRSQLDQALADLATVEQGFRVARTESARVAAARAFLAVDRGFHRLVVELAGNSRLPAIVEGLWAQIAVFQNAGSFRDQRTDLAIERHRAVIAALIDGDTEAAVIRMRGAHFGGRAACPLRSARAVDLVSRRVAWNRLDTAAKKPSERSRR